MVLIFGYVFGSAIGMPDGGSYLDFLVPGLFVTIAANIVPSMVTMARDSTRGVIDRSLDADQPGCGAVRAGRSDCCLRTGHFI